MTPPERRSPEGESMLGTVSGTPTLTPRLAPPKVGDRGGDPELDVQEEQPAPRQSARQGRSRGGRRPPPAAADAVPTTIRFDPEEARDITRFALELADQAGRRSLDKAEVFRELIRLAMEHEPTRKALVRRLK